MKTYITARLKDGELLAFGRVIKISCIVRNEENGLRSLSERPVLSIPHQKPVMPRQFPLGEWEVFKPLKRTSHELAPFFIPTSASRVLQVWTLKDGHYGEPTEEYTVDQGYGLHYSSYRNTIGCIKIDTLHDLKWFVERVNETLKDGQLYLRVV